MLDALGFTCVTFMTGALSWWGPTYVIKGIQIFENDNFPEKAGISEDNVSFVFGIVLFVSGTGSSSYRNFNHITHMILGVSGVVSGMLLSRYLRPRFPRYPFRSATYKIRALRRV